MPLARLEFSYSSFRSEKDTSQGAISLLILYLSGRRFKEYDHHFLEKNPRKLASLSLGRLTFITNAGSFNFHYRDHLLCVKRHGKKH